MKHFRRLFLHALLCVVAGGLANMATAQTGTQIAQLLASNGAANDNFGLSIAFSSDGSTALVGTYGKKVGANSSQGTAYVFTRNSTTWVQQAQLTASNGAAYDYFGQSVALSGDGITALIGAPYKTVGANSSQGAAYVFTRSGTTWVQQAQLTAANGAAYDYFGQSVSLSGDGSTALVGNSNKTVGANSGQGTAYVFTRNSNTWAQQAQLIATNGAVSDNFGQSVALSGDGTTALIGASYKTVGSNSGQGAAYVFTRSGTTWVQQAQLTAANGAVSDFFGYSVSLSSNGSTALVGAYYKTAGASTRQGATYVYTRSSGIWAQQVQLLASNGAAEDNFGISVSLSGDGSTALVGAYGKRVGSNSFQGAAYVFTRSGTTWAQQAQLMAANGAAYDYFGCSVSLSSDGNMAIVGAYNKTVGSNSSQGAAYITGYTCTSTGLPAPATGQTLAASQTLTVASGTQTTFKQACATASGLLPNGSSPVGGSVIAKEWVESSDIYARVEAPTPAPKYISRHWEIIPATGTTTATGRVTLYASQADFNSYNNSPSVSIRLPTGPNDLDGIGRLRVFKYSGTSSNGTGLPGTYSSSATEIFVGQSGIVWNATNQYWEVSFNVTGFGGFFIGPVSAVILPVKLTSFTAAKQGSSSTLAWKVTSEENIATYTIERSTDGRSFTQVGSVASVGNTSFAHSYGFSDVNPSKGANYYRLCITEKDGKVNYSEIRLLNWGSTISIALYPNPAKDKATLTGVEAGNSMRLVDAVGKVLQVQKATGTTETLLLTGLSKGLYSVQVYSTNGMLLSTARLVKE